MPGFQALSLVLAVTTVPLIRKKKRSYDKRKKEENK